MPPKLLRLKTDDLQNCSKTVDVASSKKSRTPHESKVQNREKSAQRVELFLQHMRRASMMRAICAI